jgi:hypothetical protein
VKPPLRFFPVPQIAKPAASDEVANRERQEANALFTEVFGQPFDVFGEGLRLLTLGPRERLYFLNWCSCY